MIAASSFIQYVIVKNKAQKPLIFVAEPYFGIIAQPIGTRLGPIFFELLVKREHISPKPEMACIWKRKKIPLKLLT